MDRAEEKAAEMEEKRAVYNEKESATMDVSTLALLLSLKRKEPQLIWFMLLQMFKALAKERFG